MNSNIITTNDFTKSDLSTGTDIYALGKDPISCLIEFLLDKQNMCALRLVSRSWKKGVDDAIFNRITRMGKTVLSIPIDFQRCINSLLTKNTKGDYIFTPMSMLKTLSDYALLSIGFPLKNGDVCLQSADLQLIQDIYRRELLQIWPRLNPELNFDEQKPPDSVEEILAWLNNSNNRQQLDGIYLLDLSNLPIQAFPACVFNHMKNLQYVNLENSALIHIPPQIVKLVKLKQLNMTNTKIREIPNFITDLKELNRLDVTDCSNLEVVPASILKNKKIEFISNHPKFSGIQRIYGHCGGGV